jgi:2-amino-4-hydroxy-6-hydroxymethyldihydropteridine diphosphokinase
MHLAILLLGSNISPEKNIRAALALLQDCCGVQDVSTTWQTPAVGSPGPDFLNVAVQVNVEQDADSYKWHVLRPIEENLGRMRSADKNAPRTIDIDIIVWDGTVQDANLWSRAFVAIPVSELAPHLIEPVSGKSLRMIARDLRDSSTARPRPDIKIHP